MKKNKDNYVYVPTDMQIKDNKFKVIYRRKYLGKVPKSLIYKLKKSLYQYLMNSLTEKPINNVAILNRADAVIIDRKYAKLYSLIARKYDNFEEKYERYANDLGYNVLIKLMATGKLSLGLALSLFLFLSDQELITEIEPMEVVEETNYYERIPQENVLEITEKPENFHGDIALKDLVEQSNNQEETLVYTKENLCNHLLSPEKQAAFEYYMHEYAFYFNLNADYLIDVFKQATENYSNIDLILDASRYDLDNPETIAIMYTYFFYRDPKKYMDINVTDYGYSSKDDFITTDEIFIIEPNWMHDHVKDDSVVKEDITLRNGLKYSEYLGRMSDLIGIPDEYKAYTLSVSYAERGQYGSETSIYKNNMGGLRTAEEGFKTYPSPEAGIIAFIANLRGYEWKYKINNMQTFADIYDGDEFVDQWVKNVNDNVAMITNNASEYFLTPEEECIYLSDIQTLIYNNQTDFDIIKLSLNH